MNALANFAFEEHLVRVVKIDGDPWFVGKDVCTVLTIKDHKQTLGSLPDRERRGYNVPPPPVRGGYDVPPPCQQWP